MTPAERYDQIEARLAVWGRSVDVEWLLRRARALEDVAETARELLDSARERIGNPTPIDVEGLLLGPFAALDAEEAKEGGSS